MTKKRERRLIYILCTIGIAGGLLSIFGPGEISSAGLTIGVIGLITNTAVMLMERNDK